MSHPSWVRGLKYIGTFTQTYDYHVAPLVGAWIEIIHAFKGRRFRYVAPLVGAWIEILPAFALLGSTVVAPLVGAWIEIKDY